MTHPIRRSVRSAPRKGARPAGGRGRAGFTLIEVLVAFAIVAVMLLALLEGSTRALRSIERAGVHARLLAEAENRLAEMGALVPLRPGRIAGRTAAGDEWEVTVEPWMSAPGLDPDALAGKGFMLYRVWLFVRTADGSLQSLESVRMAAVAP